MKKIKYICLVLLIGIVQSCDWLELAPTDIYSINNYWNTKDQVDRFIRGLHVRVRMRQEVFFKMGELRGGTMYGVGTSPFNQSMSDIQAINNNLSEANCVISGWGSLYMDIMQINHAIIEVPQCSFLSETEKNYDMGILHGLRAYYYFHLFRSYGGVPLVTEPEVLSGVSTPSQLNKARSTEEETYNFIQNDVKASDTYFAEDKYTSTTDKSSYWNKAATQMLKAEVLLWGCKVKPIGGTKVFSENVSQDLATAKSGLQEVIDTQKYGFATTNFADLFNESKTAKDNKEMIFVIRYKLNEEVNFFSSFLYPINVSLKGFEDRNGVSYDANQNPLQLAGTVSSYMYTHDFFKTFKDGDTRRDATFFDAYRSSDKMPAIMLYKYPGEMEGKIRRFTNDWPVYRYADLQLMMAEITAMQNGDPTTYINNVRSRAYNATALAKYKYPYGNETPEDAILEERTKEFVGEGKIWYDLRRMKNGELAKKLQTGSLGALAEQHLLWPIDAGTLSKDPLVKQTLGY